MKEDIEKLVNEEFEDLELSDKASQLVAAFVEEIMRHENVSIEDIMHAGSGKTSINLKIGEYILKVGKVRRTKEFRNSSRILQPVIRRAIEINPDESIFIEVQDEVNANWYKEKNINVYEIMYQVYKDIRKDGLLWTDIRFSNIGRLIKDNRVHYTTKTHDIDGNITEMPIMPTRVATGLKGKAKKTLKAGDYVLLDTDFVFDENNLPDGKKVKDMLLPIYYLNYELRYQQEKEI